MSEFSWSEEKAMREYLQPGTKDLIYPAKPGHSLPAAYRTQWDNEALCLGLDQAMRERIWGEANRQAEAEADEPRPQSEDVRQAA